MVNSQVHWSGRSTSDLLLHLERHFGSLDIRKERVKGQVSEQSNLPCGILSNPLLKSMYTNHFGHFFKKLRYVRHYLAHTKPF